jgi:adenine specific DNA methylase Mod
VYAKHYSLVNLDTLDAPSAPVNIRKTILEEYDNHLGTSLIKSIFNGERVFDFPKPLPFIAELISFLPNKSSVVLDFFGGSGTTGHAVMELNKKDGGNRQFILATLNEKDIAIRVTAERLRRVMTGKTSLGDNDFP